MTPISPKIENRARLTDCGIKIMYRLIAHDDSMIMTQSLEIEKSFVLRGLMTIRVFHFYTFFELSLVLLTSQAHGL